jgi:stage II sporulation protein P
VIDLHRDGLKNERKLVIDLQGRPTAQFMFFNGLSYDRKTGPIEYLANPYINENLAFSFQAQVAANEHYPGITRKIYLRAYRYNMHLLPRTTLIELGAQTNTVEEILNACEPLAHVLSLVLSKN